MNFSEIKILDFKARDADDVLRIQGETGLSVWSKTDYLNELRRDDSIFKIAQNAEKEILGFALVRLLVGDSNDSFDSSEILNIAVGRSFQGRGIGQMIFDETLHTLKRKKISEIWLEVRKSNTKAIDFYRKNGFEMRYERKNYYSNPAENALILHRSLEL